MSKWILIFFCFCSLLASVLGVYNFFTKPKIGYVRSYDLVNNYLGTKEGMANLSSKTEGWKANVDTLTLNFQAAVNKFNVEASSLNTSGREQMEAALSAKREELINYSREIEEKTQEENDKLMQGVLNQINSYVEQYGQSNGYDVILGTTISGNVLYGQKHLDITEDILRGLNEDFKGK